MNETPIVEQVQKLVDENNSLKDLLMKSEGWVEYYRDEMYAANDRLNRYVPTCWLLGITCLILGTFLFMMKN